MFRELNLPLEHSLWEILPWHRISGGKSRKHVQAKVSSLLNLSHRTVAYYYALDTIDVNYSRHVVL